MIFMPFRYLVAGIIIGALIASISDDYVIISRRKYEKLKEKAMD